MARARFLIGLFVAGGVIFYFFQVRQNVLKAATCRNKEDANKVDRFQWQQVWVQSVAEKKYANQAASAVSFISVLIQKG